MMAAVSVATISRTNASKSIAAGMLILSSIFCSTSAVAKEAHDSYVHCQFGILRLMPDGDYVIGVETKQIPRLLKNTGFRWGIAFDNPTNDSIRWYEIVHLPAPLKQMSGDLSGVDPTVVRSDVSHSGAQRIVDQFWFDTGDPLGPHTLELYINDSRKCVIQFDVVEPK